MPRVKSVPEEPAYEVNIEELELAEVQAKEHVDEKDLIIKSLEEKINNLTMQIYQKQDEINSLHLALDKQAKDFEHTIANLVYNLFSEK